jgi:hypothetical protein
MPKEEHMPYLFVGAVILMSLLAAAGMAAITWDVVHRW